MSISHRKRAIGTSFLVAALVLLALATAVRALPSTHSPLHFRRPPQVRNLTKYVNPFIGTAPTPANPELASNFASGDTFPGAVYPSGMVQWSPDTTTSAGGYTYSDTRIKGFALTTFSGRGCESYQDLPFMPYVGSVTSSPASSPRTYQSTYSHAAEAASPGYYKVVLSSTGVTAQLSATPRTGVGQFTYPAGSSAAMLINTSGSVNRVYASSIHILPSSRLVTGSATSRIGCGSAHYTVYFAAYFDQPFSSYGTWRGGAVSKSSSASSGTTSGGYVGFSTASTAVVHLQVGISFVSIANAESNVTAESAHGDLQTAVKYASRAWNARLNAIQVSGGSANEETIFYTALYHSLIHPNIFSDADGEYLGFDGQVHTVPAGHIQYENISTWDLYQSQVPLRAILFPGETADIFQSLVNDAEQGDGSLPRWEEANADSLNLFGDPADAFIATGYAFGATDFNAAAALTAMLTGQAGVRTDLAAYEKGYVVDSTTTSAAMTLQYVTDDFAIGQFAEDLGNSCVADANIKHTYRWENLFNRATGYIEPRSPSGWEAGFSPTSGAGYFEGDASQYSWQVPFDLPRLFADMGGDSAVVSRLNIFFTELDAGESSSYAFMGNEPDLAVPWEYDFADDPAETQNVVRRIQRSLFTNTPGGLPGNDDGGALSSWYIFSALGLYPEVPGVAGFVIGSPLFPAATVRLGTGKSLRIDAANGSDASEGDPYVQSLTLNGSSTQSLWLPYRGLSGGATLRFTLGSSPGRWGTSPPPAFDGYYPC